MPYGQPTLALKIGDRVTVDLRRNGKLRDGEVIGDKPRISALTSGSIEWLIRYEGSTIHGSWVSEPCIKVRL